MSELTIDGQANDCRHDSASGIDQRPPNDPSKIWRCDHCGLTWNSGGGAPDAWTDWLASIGYGIDYGAIGGAEPPCSLAELAAAYVRVTGEEDRETWAWCIAQETGVLTTDRETDERQGGAE